MRNPRRFYILVSLTALCVVSLMTVTLGFSLPKWFPFSSERSLYEWEDKIFRGKVIYTIEKSGQEGCLHALSIGSASAIFYRIKDRYKAEDYPMISWKWRVVKFPDKEKLRLRQGIEKDDYAARIYMIFPSINFMASKALEYVWDETVPVETVCASPYSKNIKLVVLESGLGKPGQWVAEERNIFEDYRRAFGINPKLKVGAIALMSDADNTQDVSEAYFGDIRIGYKKER